MKSKIIAKRYAEAFIGYAKETIGVDRAVEEFKNIRNVIRDNPGFLEILQTPEIIHAEKLDFMQQVMQDNFSREFRNFVRLLLEKERISQLNDIAEYIRVNYSHLEETDVILKTTFPLDLELIKALQQKLEQRFNKKIKFFIELDGNLLGGVLVIMGNTIIDGSVKRALRELREKLMQTRMM